MCVAYPTRHTLHYTYALSLPISLFPILYPTQQILCLYSLCIFLPLFTQFLKNFICIKYMFYTHYISLSQFSPIAFCLSISLYISLYFSISLYISLYPSISLSLSIALVFHFLSRFFAFLSLWSNLYNLYWTLHLIYSFSLSLYLYLTLFIFLSLSSINLFQFLYRICIYSLNTTPYPFYTHNTLSNIQIICTSYSQTYLFINSFIHSFTPSFIHSIVANPIEWNQNQANDLFDIPSGWQ